MTTIESIDLDTTASELVTLLDIIRWSMSQFNQADLFYGHGTDTPWSEALSLSMQALHLPQNMSDIDVQLLLHARLTSIEKRQILDLVYRRVTERVPSAYLTQQAWFCGLPFYVDERVLVPRSPFAELINDGFSTWLSNEPKQILDLCTGSGCIAIALAYQFEEAIVDAVDISSDALAVADINIQEHGLADRVFPIQSDLMSALSGQKYDLIVSNPPYVDAEDMADLPDEFQHEPELGLAAGEDGLELVDTILHQALEYLTDDGWLFVEVGNSQVHMNYKYPELPMQWIEFKQGGHGVFALSKPQLEAYWAERN
ncbi:50S ribosomal protein L3 N(5)-glutamine methyltransferase [Aliiglaciecola sp. LCG003]|uniref:50S ribosomal protein L3 N(5)-glutamine methyltransferase n=1 Tax=Aliiglaciecola sp. LCG003 TaxID=3053655 RepID=UPI0025743F0A|nr:50S ribosomal protein L3 N(5)-glutamine methyltransferase [Aliiglaciecola sp. LCG003]WJG08312.1 50S ribosomal protein L3 N(5)-glutamine methyltransferase [Aliiglaciecola sp. LCG003]